MPSLETVGQFVLNIGVGVVVAIPLLLYPFLYFNQERLLFFPAPLAPERKIALRERFPRGEVHLVAEDGTPLRGWLVNAPEEGRAPLLIYWGGNAEETSGFLLEDAARLRGWAVLSVNYRGYGESGGKPGERALFDDARLVFDWAMRHPNIHPGRIAVMGRSLGSGVAVHVASERMVAGVCLVSPYDSIRAVAQGVYPYVPVRWLLRHPFDSLERAPIAFAPLLTLMATRDTVVPVAHSRRLIANWGGPHREREFADADHNSIVEAPGYYAAIQEFLDSLPPAGCHPP
ncbi:MAG: alpha/beta hydrolase [Magnetococcales bacterium]|nr:alpha/beta hydrolase [Magnetococcales bacterium]